MNLVGAHKLRNTSPEDGPSFNILAATLSESQPMVGAQLLPGPVPSHAYTKFVVVSASQDFTPRANPPDKCLEAAHFQHPAGLTVVEIVPRLFQWEPVYS